MLPLPIQIGRRRDGDRQSNKIDKLLITTNIGSHINFHLNEKRKEWNYFGCVVHVKDITWHIVWCTRRLVRFVSPGFRTDEYRIEETRREEKKDNGKMEKRRPNVIINFCMWTDNYSSFLLFVCFLLFFFILSLSHKYRPTSLFRNNR